MKHCELPKTQRFMKCPIIGVVFVETTAHSERICWDTPLEPKVVVRGEVSKQFLWGEFSNTPPPPKKNGEKIRNLVDNHILF